MDTPYFSICIPQHNRTSFLIAALHTLKAQTFRDFEVCISDDASSDGREAELMKYLEASGLRFLYKRQATNLRYDGNLRAAIGLASGKYCFLLGNDDGLTSPNTLASIAARLNGEGVALTNYREAETGREYQRVNVNGIVGSGVDVAIAKFRDFSFVSGVIIRTDLAREHATAKWDGSEMYQVYLVSRSIASGETLLGIAGTAVEKDLRVPGEAVDSYAAKPRLDPCPITPRKFNLSALPALVSDAVSPYVKTGELENINARILRQLYAFTYPYWLLEFRRVQSWKYAAGIALGQRPSELAKGLRLSATARAKVQAHFVLSTIGGLLAPRTLTQKWITPIAYRLAKR